MFRLIKTATTEVGAKIILKANVNLYGFTIKPYADIF
jgi:hypothetical protein